MFMYSDGGMISKGAYPPWLQGKSKKRRWKRSFQEDEKINKGDKYKRCPTCRGVGGNRECTICRGGGMAPIQRQKTNGSSNYSVRPQRTGRTSPRSVVKTQNLVYDELPFVADTDGECRDCGQFPNREQAMTMANGEDKIVVQCSRCKTVMRSHRRRW